MKPAYVDSSCLVAIAFDEAGSIEIEKKLSRFDQLFSSNLLEAELRAALHREKAAEDPSALLSAIRWIYPDRALTAEYQSVLDAGDVRGADLWHLACALFLAADKRSSLTFLTLDKRQEAIARSLGLRVR